MPLQSIHPRNLVHAGEDEYAVRAIPVHSSHWKPEPESRPTSGAFDDIEMSVDLFNDAPSEHQLRENYKSKIAEKGVGFASAKVSNIRAKLVQKEIEGNVWKDPVENNDKHGIVTGPKNKRKKEAMREVFEVQIRPRAPSEVFGI